MTNHLIHSASRLTFEWGWWNFIFHECCISSAAFSPSIAGRPLKKKVNCFREESKRHQPNQKCQPLLLSVSWSFQIDPQPTCPIFEARPIYHKNSIIILPYNNYVSATETWYIRYKSTVLSITWTLLLVKICKLLYYLVSQTFMVYQHHLTDKNILHILPLSGSLSRPWASQKTFFCVCYLSTWFSAQEIVWHICFAKLKWYERIKNYFSPVQLWHDYTYILIFLALHLF